MTPFQELEAWCAEFEAFKNGGRYEFWNIVDRVVASEAKQSSYLQQENSVLHERLRKLEIALEKETERCAKIADEEYEYWRGDIPPDHPWSCAEAAKNIAKAIRGSKQ